MRSSLVLCLLFLAVGGPAQAEFRVGVSTPLSGDLAEYGAAVRNGIDLSTDEQGRGARGVQFIYEDNQYDSARAVAAYRKLAELDRVDLLYNWGEAPLHAIAPLAERAQIPTVAMSVDPEPSIGKNFIVRSINYSAQYSRVVGSYLKTAGKKRLALIVAEDPFMSSLTAELRQSLSADQQVVAEVTVSPDERDFRSQIARIRATKPDAVGVYLMSGSASAFFRQARDQQIEALFFGTDIFESRTEIADAKGSMDGAIYPNIEVPVEFAERYLARFGNDNQIAYAYNAYEFGRAVYQLEAEKRSPEELIHRLAKISLGASSFTRSAEGGGYFDFPLVIKQVQGSTFSVLN